MWNSILQLARSQMTVWRMRTACSIPKATSIHSGYATLIAVPQQQWLQQCAAMLGSRKNNSLFPFFPQSVVIDTLVI